MNTTEEIEEVKRMLQEAGSNHAEVYLAICYAMLQIEESPSKLSVILGFSSVWANQYRYIADLSDLAFSALHNGVIRPGAAKLLATLVERDQDVCVSYIIDHKLQNVRATNYVSQQTENPHRTQRVRKLMRYAWPKKNIIEVKSIGSGAGVPTPTPTLTTNPNPPPLLPVEGEGRPTRADIARRWTESTDRLCDEGVMPPEIAEALFGRNSIDREIGDLYRGGASTPKQMPEIVIRTSVSATNTNGSAVSHTDVKMEERVFLPRVVGNEHIVDGIVWILCQILKLVIKLNSVSAPKFAAAMLDPVDEVRIRNLTRQIGDQISLTEDMLAVAAKHRKY